MDRFTRQDQLEEYEADFDDLDNRLYNCEEDYFGLIMRYIRKNADRFYFSRYGQELPFLTLLLYRD